jgi:hypothetical protein
MTMEELRTVKGIKTLPDFESTSRQLAEEGWSFVGAVDTEDSGQVLVFRREVSGLGYAGVPSE